jgi:hypothetical protein
MKQLAQLGVAEPPAIVADWCRAFVRDVPPTLRARLDHRHLEPALRGLDFGPGIGASHRRTARPAHPSRQHLGHERRQLSSQTIRRPTPPPGSHANSTM